VANISLDDLADELYAEMQQVITSDAVLILAAFAVRLSAKYPDQAQWFIRRALTGQD